MPVTPSLSTIQLAAKWDLGLQPAARSSQVFPYIFRKTKDEEYSPTNLAPDRGV